MFFTFHSLILSEFLKGFSPPFKKKDAFKKQKEKVREREAKSLSFLVLSLSLATCICKALADFLPLLIQPALKMAFSFSFQQQL